MAEETSPHVKGVITAPIQLGWSSLYAPSVYKSNDDTKDDDAKEKTENTDEGKNRPKFSGYFIFDKETNADEIARHLAAIEAAEDEAIADRKWIPKFKKQANLSFKDADTEYVQASQTDDTLVILADRTPSLAGKYRLSASSYNRPHIRYLDENDGNAIFREMPTPILNPDPENEEQTREAARRKELWDRLVFPGQNVIATFTYRTWKDKKNSPGVSAHIDNIIIVGGGRRSSEIPFDQDFTTDDAALLLAWRKKNLPDYRLDEGLDFDETGDSPSAGGDAKDTAKPEPSKEEALEAEDKPAAKPRRRRTKTPAKPVKPEPDTTDDDEEDEFGDYADMI